MADETLDLKLRLSAEEREMQPIKRLMRELERMKAQADKLSKVKIGGDFVDENLRRNILGVNKGIDTLSRSMVDKARAERNAGRMSHQVWATLTNDIENNIKAMATASKK